MSVQPELKPSIIDELQEDLRTEMMQNLQLYRGKKGMDTMFDHNEELMQQLRIFLEIHELWRQIDPDGPMAKWVLEEYKALPRDLPREQLTEQGKCLGQHKKKPLHAKVSSLCRWRAPVLSALSSFGALFEVTS